MVQRVVSSRIPSESEGQLSKASQVLDSELSSSQEAQVSKEEESVQSFSEYQILPKHGTGLG